MYRLVMVDKYGEEETLRLEHMIYKTIKLTGADYIDIRKKYDLKFKELMEKKL